jgi:hypothetical protein
MHSSKSTSLGHRHALSVAVVAILCFGLIPWPASAQPEARQTAVQISFLAKVASALPVKGAVVLRAADGKGEPIRLAVTSPATLSTMLPSGSKWEVSAELPGFWAPRQSLVAGPPDQPSRLALDLWPLGTIAGIVKVKDKGALLPKQILVKTLGVPSFLKRPVPPKGAIDCPVDRKGAWSCSLPATTFDLVISAEGSTPSYRWGVKVPAGKTLSLGTIELTHGASVAGWVAVDGGRIEPKGCIARLDVVAAGGASLQSLSTMQRTALKREVQQDGFFQFGGLAPGTYSVEVQQPGYPAVRSAPIRVDPGVETLVREPLTLRQPSALKLDIRPPLDWLDHPWRAQVFKLGERPPTPLVFDGRADEDGQLTVPGQSAGRYRVSILDSLGNSLYSGEHSVDTVEGAPQTIEVRFVTVEGSIRLGDDPLPAVLWFGGHSGAVSSKMEADEKGKFHGVLPREGVWRIEVGASMPGFPIWTQADVQANHAGKATLDLALPNTRIFGRVVDEQGKPVPAADVILQGQDSHALQSADEAGGFEVRGLPEGAVWLGAEAPSQVSDRTLATLVDGRAVGPIELKLHQTRRLNGTVTSSLGPAAGARVLILARTPDGGGAAGTTGSDGTFHVDLPRAASSIIAIVSAPGFALRAFDAQVETESLLLPVTEESGDLAITLPLTSDELLRKNLFLATFQNGLPVPGAVLSQWANDHGQALVGPDHTLRVPDVAPGDYRVCLLPRQLELLLPWSSMPAGAACASGSLAPGTTLSLKPGSPG